MLSAVTHSSRAPSNRSPFGSVARRPQVTRNCADRPPCTSRRRRILPIVSTHSTPVLPARRHQPYRVRGGQFWTQACRQSAPDIIRKVEQTR